MEEYTKNREKKDIISRSIKMLTDFEGDIEYSYHDPKTNLGNITIGIGVLIVDNGDVSKYGKHLMKLLNIKTDVEFIKKFNPDNKFKLEQPYIKKLFDYALNDIITELSKKYDNWKDLQFKAQLAMINISYQWGIGGAPTTFTHINAQRYKEATENFFKNEQIYNQIELEKKKSNADDSISISRQEWNGKLIASCDPVYWAELQASQK